MYSYRILQNYSKDMFHCSILRFDKGSYLFNCCDGTQRNALEQGIKFTKIKRNQRLTIIKHFSHI